MLNINTQPGQSIYIGDNHILTLNKFNEDDMSVTVACMHGEVCLHVTPFTIGPCDPLEVVPNVNLNYHGIGDNGVQYAILGFDAPKHIRIVGEWKTGNRDPGPADRAKLSQMSDASLVYYANMHAKTPLEHELMNRFKQRLKKLTMV